MPLQGAYDPEGHPGQTYPKTHLPTTLDTMGITGTSSSQRRQSLCCLRVHATRPILENYHRYHRPLLPAQVQEPPASHGVAGEVGPDYGSFDITMSTYHPRYIICNWFRTLAGQSR